MKPFTSSFKNFKVDFFKVIIDPVLGRYRFYDATDRSLFPLYWTRNPRKFDVYPRFFLTDEERAHLDFLDILPRPIPSRSLLTLYFCPHPHTELEGITMFFFL